MKTKLLIPAALLIVGCSTTPKTQVPAKTTKQTVPHQRFVPKYDFAGSWTSDNSVAHADIRREGRHVIFTFNTSSYEHVFEGDYIDEQTIEGIQTRRKRADGTTTRMRLTFFLASPDLGSEVWIALDGNSDLSKGQTGTCVIRRAVGLSSTPTRKATVSAPAERHTTSPIHFWFDYAGTPFPGKRYWTAVGQTWIEQYESGTYSRFKVVKHTNVEGTSGTIVGDPEHSETENDGKFQVFIPDIGSEKMEFRFRHKIDVGRWEPWLGLTEIKGVE